MFGGGEGIRTPVHAFAERCLTPRPHHRQEKPRLAIKEWRVNPIVVTPQRALLYKSVLFQFHQWLAAFCLLDQQGFDSP